MIKHLGRVAAAVVLVFGLSACALTEDMVAIDYAPPAASPVEGAEGVVVDVEIEDYRMGDLDQVGAKKNGYGAEMAAIRTSQDVPELVRGAVEQQLAARGFTVADSGLTTKLTLNRFRANYDVGFWSASNTGKVDFWAVVETAAGDEEYKNRIVGTGVVDGVVVMGGDPVKTSLESALVDAVVRLMQDDDYIAALLRRGASAASASDAPADDDVLAAGAPGA